MSRKVIITCAVTGSVHTPSMSPHLPITPDEIAKQAIDAANAGASILHLHARDPKTGFPSPDPDLFMDFLPKIKLEIVVDDAQLEEATKAIIGAAKTGKIGDGKVFILPIEEAIRIRTDETGAEAV